MSLAFELKSKILPKLGQVQDDQRKAILRLLDATLDAEKEKNRIKPPDSQEERRLRFKGKDLGKLISLIDLEALPKNSQGDGESLYDLVEKLVNYAKSLEQEDEVT